MEGTGLRPGRRALLTAAALVLALVAAGAALGHFWLPGFLRAQAITHAKQAWGRDLTIGAVELDPFRLRLEVRDVALPDADGRPLFGLRRGLVDLELASLWQRAIVLREVRLEEPAARLVRRADGRFNVLDLLPPSRPKPHQDAPAPELRLQALRLSGGRIELRDESRQPAALEQRLQDVALELDGFSTRREGGRFALRATAASGGRLQASGDLALAPQLRSGGELTLSGLELPPLTPWLGDAAPVVPRSGTLELGARWRVAGVAPLRLELTVPRATLSGLVLRLPGATEDAVRLPRTELEELSVALPERRIAARRLRVEAAAVRAALGRDGRLDLLGLLPVGPAGPAGPARPARPAEDAPLRLELAELDLGLASLDLEDRRSARPRSARIAPLAVLARGLANDASREIELKLDAGILPGGRLALQGRLTPRPLAAVIEVDAQSLPLTIAAPYLADQAALSLRAGRFGTRGRLLLGAPAGAAAGPAATAAPGGRLPLVYEGSAGLDEVLLHESRGGSELLALRRVQAQGLRLALEPSRLDLRSVIVEGPRSRVRIAPDGSLNFAALRSPPDPNAPSAAPAALPPSGTRTAAAPQPRPPGAAAGSRDDPFPVRIGEVRIRQGTLDFADDSIEPRFAARIQQLQGRLAGLSSARDSRATVALQGEVGPFAPVAIEGRIEPFAFDRFTDIAMRFENISLPVFNPYSGRHAGFSIQRGKLDTNLRYEIEQRRLRASHKVRIAQLEWGEATAGREAAGLPVRFATALLKDRDGIIELDLPVTGTLDDPEFRIGPIVWKLIGNLIVKVVSAPFTALASLFKGSEEAQFVEFAPGSAALEPEAASRLAELGRALAAKPGLSIDVPLAPGLPLDRAALAEARLAELIERAPENARGGAAPGRVPFATLPLAERVAILQAVLARLGRAAPGAPAAAAETDGQAQLQALTRAAREAMEVSPAELEAVSRDRAAAVQAALLQGTGLAPQRVFIVAPGKALDAGTRVRLELTLK